MMIELTKKLRQDTGASIKNCMKAVQQSNGNLEEAKKILQIMGESTSKTVLPNEGRLFILDGVNATHVMSVKCESEECSKSPKFNEICLDVFSKGLNDEIGGLHEEWNRRLKSQLYMFGEEIVFQFVQSNGNPNPTIHSAYYIHHNSKRAAVVLFKSDNLTEEQSKIAKLIATHIVANPDVKLTYDESLEKDMKEIWMNEMCNMNKPQDIKNKIIEGKFKGWLKNNILGYQELFDGSKRIINDLLSSNNMELIDFVNYII